jgi:hypothetical protein
VPEAVTLNAVAEPFLQIDCVAVDGCVLIEGAVFTVIVTVLLVAFEQGLLVTIAL